MAKLNKETAKKAAAAESGSFEAIPEGRYIVSLRDVKTDGKGAAGPYWTWEFEIADGDYKGRRLWTNTSLSEQALWKLNEVFTALGFTTDTDTDEMCGERCLAAVSQRVIQGGARKGEVGNQIERLSPLGEEGAEEGADSDVF